MGSAPLEGKGMEGNRIGQWEKLRCDAVTKNTEVGPTGHYKTEMAFQVCELW